MIPSTTKSLLCMMPSLSLGIVVTMMVCSQGRLTMGLTTTTRTNSLLFCTTRQCRLSTSTNPFTKGHGSSLTSSFITATTTTTTTNTPFAFKNVSRKNTTGAGNRSYIQFYRQSNTLLTSSHVEARKQTSLVMMFRPARWITSHQFFPPLLRRKGSERFLLSVILTAIILFAPTFSPAARAATPPSSFAAGRGILPFIPFSTQSRALGTFSFLPNKAEMELCFRLLYAACLGAFVGLERSSSECPAGVRTMALVGLGSATYTICSTHGFIPHTALGFPPGSPFLDSVKCDISRMASNIASGVGFIGAGAIHKSTLRKDGSTEAQQNVVSGLTTASAIWVSAAVGIASAVGLYFSGAVATMATVAILKYARLPKYEEEVKRRPSSPPPPSFVWEPKALIVENDHEHADIPQQGLPRQRLLEQQQLPNTNNRYEHKYGLFGKDILLKKYDPAIQEKSFVVDHDTLERFAADNGHPIVVQQVIDPRFEQFLRSQLGRNIEASEENWIVRKDPHILIEEEQSVIASSSFKNEEGSTPTNKSIKK